MTTHSLRLFAVVLVCIGSAAHADDSRALPTVENVRVGFGNAYKLGCWTPVEATLSQPLGQGRGLEVQTLDGDSAPARFIGPASASSDDRSYLTYAKIGRTDAPLEILLNRGNGANGRGDVQTLWTASANELPRALSATNELIIEMGVSIGLADLFPRPKPDDLEGAVVATLDEPQRMPDRWYGYEGVDLVVVSDTAAVEQSFQQTKTIDALERWVRLGGVLLIACGEEAEKIVGPDAPLVRFAPGEFAGSFTLPAIGFGLIETYANAEDRLNANSLRVPQWKNVQGKVDLYVGAVATPLIVRRPLGFGQVIFVGLDLHKPPFVEWPARPRLLEKLLDRRWQRGRPSTTTAVTGKGRQLGFVDLSGQLRGALDQFEGVRVVPFWAVATLALSYIALLFPLNYWIVIRWLKRPQLAWVMFPAVAILFSVGVFAFATSAKGNRLLVNQIDLVDVDVSTGLTRGSTWFNLFSQENATFDLHVRPNFDGIKGEPTQSLLSWLGLPGVGLGGMDSRAAAAPLFDEPYTIDAGQGRVRGAPVGIWSSKAFVARWEATGGGIEANLTEQYDRRLQGTVTSRLNIPLTECVVMFDRWAWPVGTLAPGQTVRLETKDSQTIETFLTRRRLLTVKDEVPPYDRTSFDVARVMEVMMFHEAAGGTNYTGLLNHHQRFVDLSSQLELGRAAIVGRTTTGAEVQIDGQPVPPEAISRHVTVYRYVVPVKSR